MIASNPTRKVNQKLSKRQKTADNLTEFEPNFKTFTEQSPNMIFINKKGTIVYANQKCEEIMGYTREEILSPDFDFMGLISPESVDIVKANFRRHMSGEEIEPYEYRLINKNGEKIDAIITSKLIQFEGQTAILGIVTDISQLKHAERDLRKSEEKFRQAFQNSPIGMALCNMDGSYVQINSAYLQMTGYSQPELELLTFRDVTHPEDLVKQLPYYEQCVRGEIDSYQLDKRYVKKDGEIIWVNMIAAITKDETGKPLHALIMAEDITEVKMAEKNRQHLEAQLRQAQKMEAIGTLAGGIAHDFNNILGAIIGYSEMAIYDTEEGSMMRHNMEQVLKAGHRAKDLVKQILAFSRKSEQDKKIILITPIIKEVLKLLRASLPTTIEIRQHFEPNLGAIFADPTQIHQVIMNLGTNSAHAMENTGGLLEVNLLNVDLGPKDAAKFGELEPGRYVELVVNDTGHGIDAATLERIFEPYFTTKTKEKGTGMGLAVVHGIVKGHNGGIKVKSKPGKGTSFEILFPRTASEMQFDTVQLKALPTGGERILYIDDEETLIDLGENMLAKLGYHVVTRTSPIEAIEAFKVNPDKFDLVISDMTMPNMTGDILAKKLMEIRPDIPVIICTGFSEQISAEKVKAIGISGFLMKPLTIRELARTVRKVLDQQ
jgi:PAS domain S-box-containing protein